MTQAACPRCYAPLHPQESPQGLCPKCLLAVAMGEDAVLRTQTGAPVAEPPKLEELAPQFPQLELQALVGRGGAGAVYRARQRDLGRTVALKVLTLDPELDPTFGERFTREARAMASLTHPGIAAVHDAGRAGPYYYLLLEFVEGRNLRQVIQAGDLSASESLDVVRQICAALEYAHGEGVVHRDIKPENVLLDDKGRVRLVDFGLAKLLQPGLELPTLTRTAQAMGTFHYMAPEQIRRPLEVDHRADIYSLGVVLYELLTGELPLGRFAAPSVKARTDARLDQVVFKSLEQDPAARYQRVSTVGEDLSRIANQAGQGSAPAPPPPSAPASSQAPSAERGSKPSSGGRQIGMGVAAGCGCLALGMGGLLFASMLFMRTSMGDSETWQEGPVPAPTPLAGPSPRSEPTMLVTPQGFDGFSVYVADHSRVTPVVSGQERWLLVEVEPFLEKMLEDYPSAAVYQWPLGQTAQRFRLELDRDRPLVRVAGTRGLIAARGDAASTLVEVYADPPEALEERFARATPLSFEPAPVFGGNQVPSGAQLEAVADLHARYLELEQAFTRTEPLGASAVTLWIDPFGSALADLQREAEALAEEGVDTSKLLLFGAGEQPTRLVVRRSGEGVAVTVGSEDEQVYGVAGPLPWYLRRFAVALSGEAAIVPEAWQVGLPPTTPLAVLEAVGDVRGRYLELEGRNRLSLQEADGVRSFAVAPFADQRQALLAELQQRLAEQDPERYGDGGLPAALVDLLPLGEHPSVVRVEPRGPGRWTLTIASNEAGLMRTEEVEEGDPRFLRFLPR